MKFSDEELNELLDFIAGRGKFTGLGNAIHTYPNGDDNKKKIYEGCLELERRGLIVKWREDASSTIWKALPDCREQLKGQA